jgi:hypothetical protein
VNRLCSQSVQEAQNYPTRVRAAIFDLRNRSRSAIGTYPQYNRFYFSDSPWTLPLIDGSGLLTRRSSLECMSSHDFGSLSAERSIQSAYVR